MENDTGGKRTPGRPVDPRLGPAILNAVLDLLAEDGYAQLTTAAVARRAGVSTATLYRRWSSKGELILAAAEQIAAAETGDIDTGSLRGDVETLLDSKQRPLSGRIGRTLLILSGESAHDAELAGVLQDSVLEPMRQRLQTITDRAAGRGEPGIAIGADAASRIILGAILARVGFPAVGQSSTPDGPALTDADIAALIRTLTV